MTGTELQKSQLRESFEQLPLGVAVVQPDGRVDYANQRFRDMLGYSEAEVADLSALALSHPADEGAMSRELRQLVDGQRREVSGERRLRHKDGSTLWASWSVSACLSDLGELDYLLVSAQDITDRATARQRSDEAVRRLVNVSSRAHGLEFFSVMALELSKASKADITFVGKLINRDGAHSVRTLAAFRGDDVMPNFEYEIAQSPCEIVVSKSVYAQSSSIAKTFPSASLFDDVEAEGYVGTPLYSNSGDVIGILVTLFEAPSSETTFALTILQIFAARMGAELERTQTEMALQDRESQYRSMLHSSMDGFWLVDHRGQLLDVNEAYCSLTGYDREELLTMSIPDLEDVESPEEVREHVEHVIAFGHDRFESRHRCKDGRRIDVEISASYLPQQLGRILVFVRDITQAKQAERELRLHRSELEALVADRTAELASANMALTQSEQRHRAIFDLNPDAILVARLSSGKIVSGNEAASRLLGYSRDELESLDVMDVHPLSARDQLMEIFEAAATEEQHASGDIPCLRKDGTIVTVDVTTSKLILDGEPHLIGMFRDITQRKLAEERLRTLSSAMESIPAMVVITDTSGTIEYVNPRYCEVTGYSAAEAIGKTAGILESGVFPEAFHSDIWQTIRSGSSWRGEFCNTKKNGEAYWESASVSPVQTDAGEATHFVAVKVDITERVQLEARLREAKDAAEIANRAKSTFLANMSHEIRTPMNAVLGYAQLLKTDKELAEHHQGNVLEIQRAGDHLLALINDILEMSKIEAGRTRLKLAPLDLHSLLVDVLQMFRPLADSKGLELALEIGASLPRYIQGDTAKLRQVLINLLGNAHKFTVSGRIVLRANAVSTSNSPHRIEFEVQDTGRGIEPTQYDRVFRAFEQTDVGISQGGTGLGMPISRSFARLMGGDLTFKSVLGSGSTFVLEFEAEDCAVDAMDSTIPTRVPIALYPATPAPKVLVVDDVRTNRDLLRHMLAKVGFDVRVAESGEEALVVHELWSPELVLMDLRMPGMGGLEAIGTLRSSGCSARIVAVSASVAPENQKDAIDIGADRFLAKPFKEAELFALIGDLLQIDYQYEESRTREARVSTPPERASLVRAISLVPRKLVAELRDSTIKAQRDRMWTAIDAVALEAPEVATVLRQMVGNYEYDALLALLASTEEIHDA